MSRFQLACKQNSSICVLVCDPEITTFSTDETEMNPQPGATAYLQISVLSTTQGLPLITAAVQESNITVHIRPKIFSFWFGGLEIHQR